MGVLCPVSFLQSPGLPGGEDAPRASPRSSTVEGMCCGLNSFLLTKTPVLGGDFSLFFFLFELVVGEGVWLGLGVDTGVFSKFIVYKSTV
jgi:hypothetical protein